MVGRGDSAPRGGIQLARKKKILGFKEPCEGIKFWQKQKASLETS